MTMRGPRLTGKQIEVVKLLVDRCGVGGMVRLDKIQRMAVVPLWRRGLVAIWYRSPPDGGAAQGPFFNLTTDGLQFASAFLTSRRSQAAAPPLTNEGVNHARARLRPEARYGVPGRRQHHPDSA